MLAFFRTFYDMSIAVNQTPKAFLGAKLLISVIVHVTIAGIYRWLDFLFTSMNLNNIYIVVAPCGFFFFYVTGS